MQFRARDDERYAAQNMLSCGSVQSTRRFHKVSYHNLIRSDSIKPVPYYYDLTRPGYVVGCSGLQLRTQAQNIL
jgi:hypothetical protein